MLYILDTKINNGDEIEFIIINKELHMKRGNKKKHHKCRKSRKKFNLLRRLKNFLKKNKSILKLLQPVFNINIFIKSDKSA